MQQNTNPQKDTPVPSGMIEVGKLPVNTKIFVETEKFVYLLTIASLEPSVVEVESGDSCIGCGLFYQVEEIREGQFLGFHLPSGLIATEPVKHVSVSGVGESGPWSYEVF